MDTQLSEVEDALGQLEACSSNAYVLQLIEQQVSRFPHKVHQLAHTLNISYQIVAGSTKVYHQQQALLF